VRGGERIFPPALAALERLHETVMFTHKIQFILVLVLLLVLGISFSITRTRTTTRTIYKQKAPTHDEKGLK
jgi:hypothetical protein